MALTSALFTGLSGLDVNQTRLNVVGNNIANANTVAFKSSRALFKPQFYQTDGTGTPPSSDFGGSNPSQRGLGAVVATIEKDFTQGSLDPTGKPTDLGIDGDGFFVVQGSGNQKYTRDGSFSLNASNQLVTSGGDFVQGYGVDGNGNVVPGALKNLTIPLGASASARATTAVTMEGNLNADGPVATGASILLSDAVTVAGGGAAPTSATLLAGASGVALASAPATPVFSVGQVLTLDGTRGGRDIGPATFTVSATSTVGDLMTFFQQGLGIDTTVPPSGIPGAPTPGVSLESHATDPANSARLTITGNLGLENALEVTGSGFTSAGGPAPLTLTDGTNAAGVTSNPAGESVATSFVAYDSLGTPVTVNVTAALESKSDSGNTWRFYATSADDTDTDVVLGNGTLTFDSAGKLVSTTGASISIDRNNTGAATPLTMNLDFGAMTSLTSHESDLVETQQDGSPIGTLTSFSIGADGTITGAFSNGLSRRLGQVAMATFSNPEGLEDKGGNMYATGADSGVAVIGGPGSNGAGLIRAGSLEQSNVDISKEFVNMIVASTGFTASSRVISTSDQLLTELLNTSR